MTACIIVARLRARAGHADAVEALLRSFVAPSRDEDGCLFYDLHREDEDDHAFVILDGWRDLAAFDRHAAGAGVARTLTRLEPLLDGAPSISKLRRLA